MVVIDKYGHFTYKHEAVLFGVVAVAGIFDDLYVFDVHVYREDELINLDF